MAQPPKNQPNGAQSSIRPPFVLPNGQLAFSAPPPAIPPRGFMQLPPPIAAATTGQLLYAQQLVQNQINAAAIQQIVRQQSPARLNVPPSAVQNKQKDEKEMPSEAAKTSESDSSTAISETTTAFSFTNAPPPNYFANRPPHLAMTALPVVISPGAMLTNGRPTLSLPPRPNQTQQKASFRQQPQNGKVNSSESVNRRREEHQQSLIFRIDEEKFFEDSQLKIHIADWTRWVPSEPYFNLSVESIPRKSAFYDKLVDDFRLCVLGAPARVNSSRRLEPPARPSELDEMYMSHHHHHRYHNHKSNAKESCSEGESESEYSSASESGEVSSDGAESGEISDTDSESSDDSQTKHAAKRKSIKDDERLDRNAKMIRAEIEWRSRHPGAIHSDIWFNVKHFANFGPTCRCSHRAKRTGFRHNVFPHEQFPPKCNPSSDNRASLRHFRLDFKPFTNLACQEPTKILWNNNTYTFEGFSLLTHGSPESKIPPCTVNRYGIVYTIELVEEPLPTAFTVAALDMISDFIFEHLLNLFELDWLKSPEDCCRLFHVMPRFARTGSDGHKELLSAPLVLMHLINCFKPFIPFDRALADKISALPDSEWNDWRLAKLGQLVSKPGFLPGAIRLDQIDRVSVDKDSGKYEIRLCHWTSQPQQMNYLRNSAYVRALRKLMKYRYLLSNKSEITKADRQKLRELGEEVSRIQTKRALDAAEDRSSSIKMGSGSKSRLLVELNPTGFYSTGLRTDVTEYALFIPAVIFHMRVHCSLRGLETKLGYQFKDRSLYQLALTHSSYTGHIGTNSDHIHNAQANCGIRHPVFGDASGKGGPNPLKTRRKGVVQLTQLMATIDSDIKTVQINTGADMHNERLEFLGDAVLSFVVNRHIFFMFPNASEGTLSIYHSALVSNENFFRIAKSLQLESYLLYSHGPDLCVRSALDHAMANTIEALHGAIYLESGLDSADEVFARLIFGSNADDWDLYAVWKRIPPHPLQAEEPDGDRRWIEKSPVLQRLTKLEESIGVEFKHIRLLAQSMANIDTAHTLTRGNNERLEFFGDYILQLVVTDYLFHRFPKHHEGGLSLLRATLLQASTQALMAKDLNLADYLLRPRPITKKKTLADILEAFVGALYVDKGLEYVRVLCEVTLLPRLHQIVLDQSWNDPKSRLQMLCITQRDLDKEPDMPRYRVLAQMPVGPNGPRFEVAVYFRRQRLAVGVGRSKQEAEVAAAQNAIAAHGHEWAEMRRQERLLDKMRSSSDPKDDFVASIDSYIERQSKQISSKSLPNSKKISSAKVVDIPTKRPRRNSSESSLSSAASSTGSDFEDRSDRYFLGPMNDPKEVAGNSKSGKKKKKKKKKKKNK